MKKKPALSKGEMEVAKVLWELGVAGVRQVYDALPPEREMNFATVQTYLRRLETKGYAGSRLAGRSRIYSPRKRSRTVIRDTINDFVDRLFGGDSMPLVRHLIEDRGIEPADIVELRQLLERLEKGDLP